uniref:Histidinol dehydrogenase n=1 Tax=Compsopogon caeruleus TaxID=31354 RepID=A0A7S1XGU2_9RHOD|mmetsp:Transcript_7383/g.15071  ORF Transcript_7383/g.15071 Transcript_7383/m.15071 type:complete len:453 (+) Transcript_7383:90-1448(+)
MVDVYSAEEARGGILRRLPMEDAKVPPHVQAGLNEFFQCEGITPHEAVRRILKDVSERGDAAVQHWNETIDKVKLPQVELPSERLVQVLSNQDPQFVDALRVARDRIVEFHRQQPITSWITTSLGGQLGQLVTPIERIAVYVPGGTAPLPSTVLMSALPAVVAGSREIMILSPPGKATGSISDATLAACAVVSELPQVNLRVFQVGGAQAIAAAAFGTESIPRADKIVGPGNLFVTLAKREVFGRVGIDGIYGPTEALVLADGTADPRLVAADLLAQAEHDFLAIPILITPDRSLALAVQSEVERQLETLPRKEVAAHSLKSQGGIVLGQDMEECIQLTNDFAAEHVSLAVSSPWDLVGKVRNAGGLFLGEKSCEVLGDYIAGPSHVMPTGGSARFSGPLSVIDFVKIISLVGLDQTSILKIAPLAERIAREEGLDAHANAARMRYADDTQR